MISLYKLSGFPVSISNETILSIAKRGRLETERCRGATSQAVVRDDCEAMMAAGAEQEALWDGVSTEGGLGRRTLQ